LDDEIGIFYYGLYMQSLNIADFLPYLESVQLQTAAGYHKSKTPSP